MLGRARIRTVAIALLGGASLVAGVAAESAAVECGAPRPPGNAALFEHPRGTKTLDVGLVQAFVRCTTTPLVSEGGIPACGLQTPNEAAGNPTTGWHWADKGSYGRVRLAVICPASGDIEVRLELGGVVDGNGDPATGLGRFDFSARATLDDPAGGAMTTVDFPITIEFTLTAGTVKLRTTASAMLALAGYPPFPNATSLEVVRHYAIDFDPHIIEVRDVNDTVFARAGVAAPVGGGASCDVEHPAKPKSFSAPLVQAYELCPSAGNTMTEGGIAACSPPTTYTQSQGSPASGWRWDESVGSGTVRLQPRKKPACVAAGTSLPPGCASSVNPADDSSDVLVTLKMKGVNNIYAATDGTGHLSLAVLTSMHDRVGGAMTLTDFGVSIPFTLSNGKANLKTSYDAVLNEMGQPGLPACQSSEVRIVGVMDADNDLFASPGLWLP